MRNYQKTTSTYRNNMSDREKKHHAWLGSAAGACAARGLFQGRTPNEPPPRRKPRKSPPKHQHEWYIIAPKYIGDTSRVTLETMVYCGKCHKKQRHV